MDDEPLRLEVEVLPHGEGLPLPEPATPGSAGLDLRAAVERPLVIPPGGRALVPTGLRVALPPGTEGQLRPRSGLALRHGLTLLNAPGTLDEDYRGELKLLLVNLGDQPYTVRRGDRIAQLVVAPVLRARAVRVESLPPSRRGGGGFGSTGVD